MSIHSTTSSPVCGIAARKSKLLPWKPLDALGNKNAVEHVKSLVKDTDEKVADKAREYYSLNLRESTKQNQNQRSKKTELTGIIFFIVLSFFINEPCHLILKADINHSPYSTWPTLMGWRRILMAFFNASSYSLSGSASVL